MPTFVLWLIAVFLSLSLSTEGTGPMGTAAFSDSDVHSWSKRRSVVSSLRACTDPCILRLLIGSRQYLRRALPWAPLYFIPIKYTNEISVNVSHGRQLPMNPGPQIEGRLT